jgi:hypothetical protein
MTKINCKTNSSRPRSAVGGRYTPSPSCPITCTWYLKLSSPTSADPCFDRNAHLFGTGVPGRLVGWFQWEHDMKVGGQLSASFIRIDQL